MIIWSYIAVLAYEPFNSIPSIIRYDLTIGYKNIAIIKLKAASIFQVSPESSKMSIKLTSPRFCYLHDQKLVESPRQGYIEILNDAEARLAFVASSHQPLLICSKCEERLTQAIRMRNNVETINSRQTMKIDVALSVVLSESPSKLKD